MRTPETTIVRGVDTCESCGSWRQSGKDKNRRYHRENPIYGTDFERPLHQIVEDARRLMLQARDVLSDIHFAEPGWAERTDDVAGLITCGVSQLYGIAQEMEWVARERAEANRD